MATDNKPGLETPPRADMSVLELLTSLAQLLSGEQVSANEFSMDNAVGKGVMRGLEVAPGLELITWRAQLYQPLKILRASGVSAPVWSILLTDSPRLQAAQSSEPDPQSGSMAYLYNHHLNMNMFFQNTGPLRMLLIRLKPPVWEHILVEQPGFVAQFIQSDQPQFHGLALDETLLNCFNQLLEPDSLAAPPSWETLILALTICNQFFTGLSRRQPSQGLREKDIERLHRAHALLLADFQNPVSTEVICKQVGLGRDKFRQLFQQVYDTTPYQYFQQHRMEQAKRLIQSGECSPMEAGYRVGYSHLGHFAKAFKKQFRVLPKEIKTRR